MSKPQRPEKMTAPSEDRRVSDVIQKAWANEDTDHKDWVIGREGSKDWVVGDAPDHKDWVADDDGGVAPVFKFIVPEEVNVDAVIKLAVPADVADDFVLKHHLGPVAGDAFQEVQMDLPDSVVSPRDSASGLATGRRQHQPVQSHAADEFDVVGTKIINTEVKLAHSKGEALEEIAFADGGGKGGDGYAEIVFPQLEAEADDEFVDFEPPSKDGGGLREIDFPHLEAEADDEFMFEIDGELAGYQGDNQPETQMVFTNDTIDKATGDEQAATELVTNETVEADTMDLTYQKIETVVIEEPPQDFTESAVWQDDWEAPPAVADDGDGMGLDG